MSEMAIRAENISKAYRIGAAKSGELRHSIGNKIQSLFRPDSSEKEVFWALEDVSFEVQKGEALGIIGRNGAGKSTLLKILSRITDPTKGRFEINGRVSSLLEVGTGFHPELSGRENIYLNGTILGMKRAEIRRKFEEIVEFSGVQKFIETPVKHYSSGMKVRLAFSVAAHLEPEILIVDEVLAVGDAEFQKKCLGKMDEVSKEEGRTILFVSHNMGAVESLCTSGILLENGHVLENAPVSEVIIKYLQNDRAEDRNGQWAFPDRAIKGVKLYSDGIMTENVLAGSELQVELDFDGSRSLENIVLGFTFRNSTGVNLTSFNNRHLAQKINTSPVKNGRIKVSIPNLPIYKQDRYWLDIYLGDLNEDFDTLIGEVSFNVISRDVYHSGSVLKQEKNLIYFPNISYNFHE